jgi:Tol biopolymer transport system component
MRATSRRISLACLSSTLLVLLVLVVSCRRAQPRQYSEVILFSTQGTTPFSDYVWTIQPDGSDPKRLLSPTQFRSYAVAAGNNLKKGIVVSVHQSETGEIIEDHLFLFWPEEGRWHRLITEDLIEGIAMIAPDDVRVAFVAAPKERPGDYRIWLTDTASGKVQKISDDEEGTWDGYPDWHPMGRELAFLRFRRTAEGLITKLMVSRLDSGSTGVLLNTDSVLSFCYAPDGERIALWTKAGLEILKTSDMSRRVILPIDRLGSTYRLRANNMSWSRTEDKVVYAVMNIETKTAEMWTISSDGSDARKIYSTGSGTITRLSFVER